MASFMCSSNMHTPKSPSQDYFSMDYLLFSICLLVLRTILQPRSQATSHDLQHTNYSVTVFVLITSIFGCILLEKQQQTVFSEINPYSAHHIVILLHIYLSVAKEGYIVTLHPSMRSSMYTEPIANKLTISAFGSLCHCHSTIHIFRSQTQRQREV